MKPWPLLLVLLFSGHAHGETVIGRVVGVSGGDTITAQVERQAMTVWLAGIDAPGSRQAYGMRSKQALSDLCFGKDAKLETQGKDRYGRTVATVYCAGRNANAEQVWQGMAWVFERYAKPESPLYILQEQAKAARRGLWSEPNPMAPWEWRGRERSRKDVAPSEGGNDPAVHAQPQTGPRTWICDRKDIPEQKRGAVDCGWR